MARSAKKRHQKKKGEKSASMQRMINELKESDKFKNFRQVERPAGMVKMSDAIAEIIEPYKDMTESLDEYKKLVSIACLAWNIKIMPKHLREFEINKITKGFTGVKLKDKQDFKAIIKTLMERKELLYPEDKRLIVNYEVTESKKGFRLNIAYALRKEEHEKKT